MSVLHNKSNLLAITIGLISSLLYLSLALSSRSYGELELNHLLIVCSSCALLSFYLWHIQTKAEQQIGVFVLLGFAVLFRIIGGFTFPILEDDFYRYLWDGRATWLNGTPYDIAPASAFGDDSLSERFELILDSINYPEVTTVYGPSCQWLFALSYLIAPGEVWPLKLVLGVADLILIILLLKLAKPNSVMLYAWCPLVIKEFVITAHPDLLGILFVVVALIMHQQKRVITMGCFMALAAGVKVFALLLLPFILQFYWRAWLSFMSTALLIALPFGVLNAWLPGGLSAMGSSWLFNAPIYSLAGQGLDLSVLKLGLLFCLAVICATHFWNIIIRPRLSASLTYPVLHRSLRGDLLYAALFLCAPAMNPWYFVWLLPFAVLQPSAWAWLASLTILLSYASGINLSSSGLEPYAHWPWVLGVEYIPPLLAFIAAPQLTRYYRSLADKKS